MTPGLGFVTTLALLVAAVPSVDVGGAYQIEIDTAAARFDLDPRLIEAVIRVESAGDARAVSRAGAMGLMQLMPGTWAELRTSLALGSDPFAPRDNVLAGAAYLRWLHDRYGAPGFLAAYNAGPGRYEQSLAGRPLPLETRLYVARLMAEFERAPPQASQDWRLAGLFPGSWGAALGPATGGRGWEGGNR